MNISIDNKEEGALKYALAKKEASQLHCFTGSVHASVPTNSVDVTTSVEEDVSTLTQGIMNPTKKTVPEKHFLKGSPTGDEIIFVFCPSSL